MKVKKLLGQTSFFILNKAICYKVGVEASLLLSYLVDKMDSFGSDCINRDGKMWFFRTANDIQDETTLTYNVQKTCISKLEKNGFINTKLMGVPRKLYFTINSYIIFESMDYINEKSTTIDSNKSKDSINEESFNENSSNENSSNEKENLQKNKKSEILKVSSVESFTGARPTSFKKWSLQDFENSIKENGSNFNEQLLMRFYDYWREPDPNGKMKFQKQDTWDTKLRLNTWYNNSLNFNKGNDKQKYIPPKVQNEMDFDNAFLVAANKIMNE